MRIEEVMDEEVIKTPDAEVRYYDLDDRHKNWLTVHMALEDNPVYDTKQLENFYKDVSGREVLCIIVG